MVTRPEEHGDKGMRQPLTMLDQLLVISLFDSTCIDVTFSIYLYVVLRSDVSRVSPPFARCQCMIVDLSRVHKDSNETA